MATIAKLSVQLEANPTGFVAGLNKAGASLRRFGSLANPNRLIGGLNSGLARLGAGFAGMLAPIKQLAASIPLVGAALASFPTTVGGFFAWFKEGAGRITALYKLSQKLGVEVETMGGFALAAGDDIEGFGRVLLHFNHQIQEASVKAEGTEATFGRLGLSAADLKGMLPTQALGAVADKINALQNPAQKAAAIFDIFGERGARIAPLLARGSKGMEAMQEQARKLGLSFDSVDAQQVLLANRAIKQMDMAVAGVKTQIAVGLAPVIAALGEQLTQAGVSAEEVIAVVLGLAQAVGALGAAGVEVGKGFVMVWDVIRNGWQMLVNEILKDLVKIFDLYGELPDMMGGDKFRGIADSLRVPANELNRVATSDLRATFDKWAHDKSAYRDVADFFNQIEAMIAAQKKALREKVKAPLDLKFDLFAKGLQVAKEVETPFEKFGDRIRELNKLMDAGAITGEIYARAVGMAAGALKGAEFKQSAAMDFGSQEAFKTITHAQLGDTQADPVKRLEDIARASKELQRRQAEANEELVRLARKGFVGMGAL